MVKFEISHGAVIVSFAEKTAEFRLDALPPDWQTLLRDPEVAASVNDLVLRKGVPEAERNRPTLTWDEVAARAASTSGAASSG